MSIFRGKKEPQEHTTVFNIHIDGRGNSVEEIGRAVQDRIAEAMMGVDGVERVETPHDSSPMVDIGDGDGPRPLDTYSQAFRKGFDTAEKEFRARLAQLEENSERAVDAAMNAPSDREIALQEEVDYLRSRDATPADVFALKNAAEFAYRLTGEMPEIYNYGEEDDRGFFNVRLIRSMLSDALGEITVPKFDRAKEVDYEDLVAEDLNAFGTGFIMATTDVDSGLVTMKRVDPRRVSVAAEPPRVEDYLADGWQVLSMIPGVGTALFKTAASGGVEMKIKVTEGPDLSDVWEEWPERVKVGYAGAVEDFREKRVNAADTKQRLLTLVGNWRSVLGIERVEEFAQSLDVAPTDEEVREATRAEPASE